MGSKPLRPCRHPGCCQLVADGYCDAHKPRKIENRSEEARQWHKLYKLDIWTQYLRPMQLAKEPFCRSCSAAGLRVRAEEVDHIVDHKGNMALFTDPDNLQSLCHGCHSSKTMKELRKNGKKKTASLNAKDKTLGRAHAPAHTRADLCNRPPGVKKF